MMTPGSANINQRSLAGSRDTELAVVLHQVRQIETASISFVNQYHINSDPGPSLTNLRAY